MTVTDVMQFRPTTRRRKWRGPARAAAGLAYGVSQAARTVWFSGHYLLAARLAPPMDAPPPAGPLPGWGLIMADLRELYRRDWSNIVRGRYPMPDDLIPDPAALLRQSGRFLNDLPAVNQRRRGRADRRPPAGEDDDRYPDYYLQNFHHQSDGWLSAESAKRYDYQVEILFTGGADAMRRQALPPISAYLAEQARPNAAVLDIGCGAGRFLREVDRSFPGLDLIGLDLSRPYLEQARRTLRRRPDARLIEGAAEDIPQPDASVEIATCIYLFHELPAEVRRKAAAEIARVLKPGGICIFVDSVQHGDYPPYDILLERFPLAFHEPYYADYVRDDLPAVFAAAGLETVGVDRAFFSRIMTMRKPDRVSP